MLVDVSRRILYFCYASTIPTATSLVIKVPASCVAPFSSNFLHNNKYNENYNDNVAIYANINIEFKSTFAATNTFFKFF